MNTGTTKAMTDQLSGKVLAEKYKVGEPVRAENSDSLYHAMHLLMEKPVAVKILAPALAVDETIARAFSDEAKTLSKISHPNILNVTDYGKDKDNTAFIVFEEIEGEPLKNVIKRDGKFSLERANRIVRQIAAALSVAHAHDAPHGRLTSENIYLGKTNSDAVKVLNFGTENFDDSAEIFTAEAEYLAPEQFADSTKTDARSDVYSLGIILYEMLAGEVPFTAEKTTDVMLKHAQEPPLPLSAFRADLPNEISQIVLTALAKNPDMRFQTATDFAAALNRATASAGSTEPFDAHNLAVLPAANAVLPRAEEPHNNLWKTAFIVLAGIAVMSAFLFHFFNTGNQKDLPTQLQPDANSAPVQPVNPATGSTEQSLSNMGAYSPEIMNSNTPLTSVPGGMPQTLPGGDGYDPWRNGGKPPAGAPAYQQYPGYTSNGQTVYIDPNSNSPFMPREGTIYMVPKNTNSNVNVSTGNSSVRVKPSANSNTQTSPANTAKPAQTPAGNGTAPKTEPTPAAKKPVAKPTPAKNTPAKTEPSGK